MATEKRNSQLSSKKTAKKKSVSSKKSVSKKKSKVGKKRNTESITKKPAKSRTVTTGKTSDPEKRMRELTEELRHHQYLYYVENNPIISDREFDRLLDELQSLEEEYPLLADPRSPTRMVGSDLESEFPKFEHTIRVLSLSNTYSTKEALDWAQKTAGEQEKLLFDVQWKVDGATLVLYYRDGFLERAVTRGSGQIGDEVTPNALTIRSIPHRLKESVDLTVRGEAYMSFSDFQIFNESSGTIYANPRNLTAGSLKHKKSKEVATRPIRWVAFEGHFQKSLQETEKATLSRMKELGLPIFDDNEFVSFDDLSETISRFEKRKKSMDIPVDGLVIKVDDFSFRKKLGFTAHSPRWATSLKFEPETANTRIVKIEFFVGRTGRVTPRAALNPVKLAGTTVSFATLHNADYIHRLGAKEGSLVKISKRGEIIPAVEEVIEAGDGPEFIFPDRCPSCSSKLVREEDAADFLCTNLECDERLINALIFFCQRKQMDISGMGEKVIRTLYEKGFIRHLEDIYRLKDRRSEIEQIEGFGKKSVDLLMDGIEKSKGKGFRKVLPSMGLREVGPNISEILIDEGYSSIEKIYDLVESDSVEEVLSAIDGVGPRTVEAIINQFRDTRIRGRIEALRKAGLQMETKRDASQSNRPQIFKDQIWCVTGSFHSFRPRDKAMEEVRLRGGKTTTSVSASTTHLLAGEGAGSKLKKAEQLGVLIVDEEEFLRLLGDSE